MTLKLQTKTSQKTQNQSADIVHGNNERGSLKQIQKQISLFHCAF